MFACCVSFYSVYAVSDAARECKEVVLIGYLVFSSYFYLLSPAAEKEW